MVNGKRQVFQTDGMEDLQNASFRFLLNNPLKKGDPYSMVKRPEKAEALILNALAFSGRFFLFCCIIWRRIIVFLEIRRSFIVIPDTFYIQTDGECFLVIGVSDATA